MYFVGHRHFLILTKGWRSSARRREGGGAGGGWQVQLDHEVEAGDSLLSHSGYNCGGPALRSVGEVRRKMLPEKFDMKPFD